MSDPLDQPEPDGYDLVVPFVICTSQGGPFDDDAFVAGYQCGEIDKTLATVNAAASVGAPSALVSLTWTVRTDLLRQLELVAMSRGFPYMAKEAVDDMPEWTVVTFSNRSPQPTDTTET